MARTCDLTAFSNTLQLCPHMCFCVYKPVYICIYLIYYTIRLIKETDFSWIFWLLTKQINTSLNVCPLLQNRYDCAVNPFSFVFCCITRTLEITRKRELKLHTCCVSLYFLKKSLLKLLFSLFQKENAYSAASWEILN